MEGLPLPASATPQLRRRLGARASAWPGPEVPQAVAHGPTQGALTARDRVKSGDLGEGRTMSPSPQVHRLSAAGMHFPSSIVMIGEYMDRERCDFSTMALDLRLVAEAKAGDRIDVRTSIAQ